MKPEAWREGQENHKDPSPDVVLQLDQRWESPASDTTNKSPAQTAARQAATCGQKPPQGTHVADTKVPLSGWGTPESARQTTVRATPDAPQEAPPHQYTARCYDASDT